jgi:hypothetical protein
MLRASERDTENQLVTSGERSILKRAEEPFSRLIKKVPDARRTRNRRAEAYAGVRWSESSGTI